MFPSSGYFELEIINMAVENYIQGYLLVNFGF